MCKMLFLCQSKTCRCRATIGRRTLEEVTHCVARRYSRCAEWRIWLLVERDEREFSHLFPLYRDIYLYSFDPVYPEKALGATQNNGATDPLAYQVVKDSCETFLLG